MNTISKTHKRLSERLNDPKVLTNPEEFLGPNYKEVLNFWLILDELSEEQLKDIEQSFWFFYDDNNGSELDKAADLAWGVSKELVGEDYAYNSIRAAWDVSGWAVDWTTLELIGMHKILEDHQQPLTFFPMFLEVL